MRALTRRVAPTYSAATADFGGGGVVDPERAVLQHEGYVSALRKIGFEVDVLASDPAYPDSTFVEDTAVVLSDRVLLTRCGHPSRQGEEVAIGEYFAGRLPLEQMEAPATLDGGDVLVVGGRVFVGASTRTNREGIEALQRFVAPFPLVVVDLPAGVLHLQSVCTTPAPDTVLIAEGSVSRQPFEGMQTWVVPAEEAYAANVVAAGGHVLVADGFPRTADLLAARGLEVVLVDTSQFRAMDGGLTCLSLRGSW